MLLAGLPALQRLHITAAYCRLEGQGEGGSAAGGQGPEGAAAQEEDEGGSGEAFSDAQGRRWVRRQRRVPVERPGSKRSESWHDAWWQPDVLAALQVRCAAHVRRAGLSGCCAVAYAGRPPYRVTRSSSPPPACGGACAQAMFGPGDASVMHWRVDAYNVPGWVAIRPDNPATFDLELEYRRG